jgi:predicted nucleic acid-binding protein
VSYLLDTNVISELIKTGPAPEVSRFVDAMESQLYVSVISFAEVRFGVACLDHGRRRRMLEDWLSNDLPDRFGNRILDVDAAVAKAWGDLMALSARRGTNVQAMDGLLAATAFAHDLTLVTRNTRDFAKLDLPMLNPWDEA